MIRQSGDYARVNEAVLLKVLFANGKQQFGLTFAIADQLNPEVLHKARAAKHLFSGQGHAQAIVQAKSGEKA